MGRRGAEWSTQCQKHQDVHQHTRVQGGASPHDEVKLRPGQHENAQQRGDGSVDHRGKHVLQSHSGALVSVSNRRQEALR